MQRLLIVFVVSWLAMASTAKATPVQYALQQDLSSVGFEADFGKDHITGKMPITKADLTLDFDQIVNCKVAVTLDASHATASFPFAAQAMKGPKILDTDTYPLITFASNSVQTAGSGAKVTGLVTIRGISLPLTLDAEIYRQNGRSADDLSHLSVHLTGVVHRSQFGAKGWSDMVGDDVRLDILVRIAQVN